jgi:hypothetical protein
MGSCDVLGVPAEHIVLEERATLMFEEGLILHVALHVVLEEGATLMKNGVFEERATLNES